MRRQSPSGFCILRRGGVCIPFQAAARRYPALKGGVAPGRHEGRSSAHRGGIDDMCELFPNFPCQRIDSENRELISSLSREIFPSDTGE